MTEPGPTYTTGENTMPPKTEVRPAYAVIPLGDAAAIYEAIALIIAQDYRRAAWIFHLETDARQTAYEARHGPMPAIPDDFAPTPRPAVTIAIADGDAADGVPSPVSPGGPNPR
jgi:hypothetical protein